MLLKIQTWFLYGLLCFLPLLHPYVLTEPYAVSYINIVSIIFILFGIVNMLTGRLKVLPIEPKGLRVILGLFILAMLWALIFTDPISNGFGTWISRVLQPLLVGYGVYLLIKNNQLTTLNMLRALLYSLIPLTLICLLQLNGYLPFQDASRVSGFYESANLLARFVSFVMLLGLPIIFQKCWWLDRFAWILGLPLIWLSQSYGGSIALWSGLLAALFVLPPAYRRVQLWGIGALSLAALLVVLYGPHLPKWEQTITYSISGRVEFWRVAVAVISDHFWTGIGLKGWETSYPDLVRLYGPSNPMSLVSSHPHNVFLDSFLKGGLPGFIGITAFLVWGIQYGWQALRQNRKTYSTNYWLGLGLMSYGIGLLVFGQADDPVWSHDSTLILMVSYFGIAAATTSPKTI